MQRTSTSHAACRRAVRQTLESLEMRALFSVAADLLVEPLAGPVRPLDGAGLHVEPLTSVAPLQSGPAATGARHARHRRDAAAGYCQPDLRFLAHDGAKPAGSGAPVGYAPDDIRRVYGFDRLSFGGGAVRGNGSGQTIAIVDAFDDPNIEADLATFDRTFGLADASFRKVDQDGGTAFPVADATWASEIALDVEWAHAMAPGADILLVEAADNSYTNLMAAVDFARRQAGVSVVSMSWGGDEFASETAFDGTFTTPAGHQGVTFLASTGDNGAPCSYPACSPNVVAVGGTSLYTNGQGGYETEVGWSGSGGGVSQYELRPAYQAAVNPGGAYRTTPDVAFDADPYTGVAVCDSFGNDASAPWVQYGGTSFSAPAWASLVAIMNQGRSLAGQGSMDGATQTLPALYAAPSRDFHDVTTGYNGYDAGAGYDLVTGLGSPDAPALARDLLGRQGSAPRIQGSDTATAGSPYTLKLLPGTGDAAAANLRSWTVNWGDGTTQQVAGSPASVTHVYAGDASADRSYTVTATASDGVDSFDAGSVTVNVHHQPPAASAPDLRLAWSQQPPRSTTAGNRIKATIRVSNLGDARARGTTDVTFYASLDGTLDGAVMLRRVSTRIRLKAGGSADLGYRVRIPGTLASGKYRLIAVINQSGAIPEQDATDDLAISRPVNINGASGQVVAAMPTVRRTPFSSRPIAPNSGGLLADLGRLAEHDLAAALA